MTAPLPTYDELRASHRWGLPERLNIGVEVADRQPAGAPAILVTDGREITRTVSFGELSESSNRLANALAAKGVGPGDRVAIILSQRPETAIAHVAAYKLGAIAVPLSSAFGPRCARGATSWLGAASGHRRAGVARAGAARSASTASLIDVDRDLDGSARRGVARVRSRRRRRPTRPRCSSTPPARPGRRRARSTATACSRATCPGSSSRTTSSRSRATGSGRRPTGPGSAASTTSSCPASRTATPVVAFRAPRFDPEQAFDVIAHAGIRNVFMPATALADDAARGGACRCRCARSRAAARRSARRRRRGAGSGSACALNEFYGQTEANLLIGNCAAWPERPGWMGRAYPGHELRLVDGEIAVRVEGDPVVFLGYWRDEAGDRGEGARRLAAHGRPRRGRRRGHVPQHRAGRRPHLERRPPDRAGRDRGVPDPPSGRVDRGRDRDAGRGPRRGREGVRRDRSRHSRLTRARDRAPASSSARAWRRTRCRGRSSSSPSCR